METDEYKTHDLNFLLIQSVTIILTRYTEDPGELSFALSGHISVGVVVSSYIQTKLT